MRRVADPETKRRENLVVVFRNRRGNPERRYEAVQEEKPEYDMSQRCAANARCSIRARRSNRLLFNPDWFDGRLSIRNSCRGRSSLSHNSLASAYAPQKRAAENEDQRRQ